MTTENQRSPPQPGKAASAPTPVPANSTTDAESLVKLWLKTQDPAARLARDRFHKLKVQPPKATIFPQMSRTGTRIAPALLDVFAKLVLGELPWPLFLHGSIGTGKTRAALYLCDSVESARYYTAEDIADAIMAHGCVPDMTRQSLIVLDELAERVKASDLGYQAVKRVLDARERWNHYAAVIISNFAPDELEQSYDGRIVSRLKAGTVFELKAKDRRQE